MKPNRFKGSLLPVRSFITLLFLISCDTVHSQLNFSFFADTVQKGQHGPGRVVQRSREFIYVGGEGLNSPNFNAVPTVTKMDTAGHVYWTCTFNKQFEKEDNFFGGTLQGQGWISRLVYDTAYLYATAYLIHAGKYQLWKIREDNGDLVWKKEISQPFGLEVAGPDYVAYNYSQGGWQMALVEKSTGKTVLTRLLTTSMGINQDDCYIKFEPDGTAYIIKRDSILKYTAPDLNTLVWNKKVISYPGFNITQVRIESDGWLYYAGHSICMGRINKVTGSPGWFLTSPYPPGYLGDYVKEFKTVGNHVYMCTEHAGVGSGYYAYRVWKVNRNTGQTAWEFVYSPFWNSVPTTSGACLAALTFDVDSLGNVYTGGYESGDYSGYWSVNKINASGSLVYHKLIFDGVPFAQAGSWGLCSFVFNNRVYHVGNLVGNYNNVWVVATDTGSVFNPYASTKTVAHYQDFSDVKDILNFSAYKYAVLKQLGRSAVVEMYDAFNNNLLWKKTINGTIFYAADHLSVTLDKRLSLDILCHANAGYYPNKFDYNKQKPDSIYFMILDSLGNVLNQKKMPGTYLQNDFKSLELYTDTSTALIYSQTGITQNAIFVHNPYRSTQPMGNGYDQPYGMYTPKEAIQNYFLPIAPDSAMYFWNRTPHQGGKPQMQLYKFNITSQSGYSVMLYKTISRDVFISNASRFDTSSVILIGKTYVGSNPDIFRYNFRNYSIIWGQTEVASYIIDVAGVGKDRVYWSGRSSKDLMVRQLDAGTGATKWQKIISSPGSSEYYYPVTQKFNELRYELNISGFIIDSSVVIPTQKPFYIKMDTLGNVLVNWIGTPELGQQNNLKALEISTAGQTLLGGAYYKNPYGRSGVILAANSPLITCLAPAITSQPVNQTVCSGANVSFATIATGIGLSYQWQFNGNNVTVGTGGTTSNYNVTASAATQGSYSVIVTSGGCATTSNVVNLTVNAATAITSQPISVTACQGSANFSVAATGSGVLGYQWTLDGVNINGATSSSVAIPVATTAAGPHNVAVVVSGSCGNTTSNNAVFTVQNCTAVSNLNAEIFNISIAPNIVNDIAHVTVTAAKAMKIVWVLTDAQGKIVMRFTNDAKPGKNDLPVNVGFLSNGIYNLQGSSPNGKMAALRFVKI